MEHVLAVDPGPHTGMAWFADGEFQKSWALWEPDEETALYRQLWHELSRMSTGLNNVTVVVESYRTVRMTTAGIVTVKLIGFIEGVSTMFGFHVVEQMSSVRKPYASDAMLLPHRGDHELSAISHGLAYLAKRRKEVNDARN